jgi:hypothetical protein
MTSSGIAEYFVYLWGEILVWLGSDKLKLSQTIHIENIRVSEAIGLIHTSSSN